MGHPILRKGGKNLHFCDWSTLCLIFLHIIYSFTPPSFEFHTNSESDQLHFHTEIIFFFFPLFAYFLFCFISPCLFLSHLCLLLKSQSTRNLELNFGFLLTVFPSSPTFLGQYTPARYIAFFIIYSLISVPNKYKTKLGTTRNRSVFQHYITRMTFRLYFNVILNLDLRKTSRRD